MKQSKKKVIILAGPTASGKTALAAELIRKYPMEIISADSRQVYRGLDIGTGKDKTVPQFMIDVVAAPKIKIMEGSSFSVSDFKNMALAIMDDIWQRGKIPLIVGGTGYYIEALVYEQSHNLTPPDAILRQELEKLSNEELLAEIKKIDPQTAGLIDPKNRVRLIRAAEIIKQTKKPRKPLQRQIRGDVDVLWYVLDLPREELYKRIDKRVDDRIKEGMIMEVQGLLREGVSSDWLLSLGLEYYWITKYLLSGHSGERSDATLRRSSGWPERSRAARIRRGSWTPLRSRTTGGAASQDDILTKSEMIQRLKFAIHRYARRQITFFHRWPDAHWGDRRFISGDIQKVVN